MGLFDIFKRNDPPESAVGVCANKVADAIENLVGIVKAAPSDHSDKVIAKFIQRRKEIIKHLEEQNWTPEEQREMGERGFVAAAGALQCTFSFMNNIEDALQGECIAYLWLASRAGGSKRAEAAHAILEEIASRY